MRNDETYDPSDGFGPDDWEYDEDDCFEDWHDLDEERPAFWEIEEPAH